MSIHTGRMVDFSVQSAENHTTQYDALVSIIITSLDNTSVERDLFADKRELRVGIMADG